MLSSVTVHSPLPTSSDTPVTTSLLRADNTASIGSGISSGHVLSNPVLQNARMAVSTAMIRSSGSPTISVSPSQQHIPSVTTGPHTRCCDTGRPVFTDPLSGQTVCSCQYEILGSYQRLGSLPSAALSMYSTPYAAAAAAAAAVSDGITPYFPGLTDQGSFYSHTGNLDLKENLSSTAASAWPYSSVYHPYDAAFTSYPFNGYSMDFNGSRRKNATRETTSTLKAWLNDHKKNPYPTKGEKIMLAVITKMTLTQVSTWFANARRRLKKENKMTWEPRNRVEDEDNNNDEDDVERKPPHEKDRTDSKDSGTGSSDDGERSTHRMDLLNSNCSSISGLPGRIDSEWNESRADSGPDSPECLYDQREPRHHLPNQQTSYIGSTNDHLLRQTLPDTESPNIHYVPSTNITTGNNAIKPRIWSLADMASKDEDLPNSINSNNVLTTNNFSLNKGSTSSKILSPLTTRLSAHHSMHSTIHSGSQYVRSHHDFYRNFYSAPQLNTGELSLLESYSRSLGNMSNIVTQTSSPVTSSQSTLSIRPFSINGSVATAPSVCLTTALSGISPSSSSTTSSNGSEQSSSHHIVLPLRELQTPERM